MDDSFSIVCPLNKADLAEEIVGTIKGLDTGDGNINPQYGRHKVIPYQRMDDTDTNNWCMVNETLMKQMLLFITRIAPEFKSKVDFKTLEMMQSVYTRFAVGFTGWHWINGHIVS